MEFDHIFYWIGNEQTRGLGGATNTELCVQAQLLANTHPRPVPRTLARVSAQSSVIIPSGTPRKTGAERYLWQDDSSTLFYVQL